MNVDLDNDWTKLAGTARSWLDNPALLPVDAASKHFSAALHLWIRPTFTPEINYVFYEPNRNLNPLPKPFVRAVEWNRTAELSRYKNGETIDVPTFSFVSAEIEFDDLRRITRRLSSITFAPFRVVDFDGRDGDSFGVQSFGLFQIAKISWWSFCSDDWAAIAGWHAETVAFIDAKLNPR